MHNKADFLVSYDFGKAGVWGIMKARSEDEIKAKYPELEVVRSVAPQFIFDVDEEPSGWLVDLVRERGK